MILGKEYVVDRNIPLILAVPKEEFDFSTAIYWMELGYPVRHFCWRKEEVDKYFENNGEYPSPNVKFMFLKDKRDTEYFRRLWCKVHNHSMEFEVCAVQSWEILSESWELYEDKKLLETK
jgi:hypothetical protein